MSHILYFAYGSNLDHIQMAERCPRSRLLGVGSLSDMKLSFTGHSSRWDGGVATVLSERGAVVEGILYQLTSEDLIRLDRFEGVPTVYERTQKAVAIWTGDACRAWVYLHREEDWTKPSVEYFEQIEQAYNLYGFDGSRLVAAARMEESA